MDWINYKEQTPPLGIEVIAQSKDWIIEDYNPRGIRIGFQDFSQDEDGLFVSAKYNNCHDCYDTDDESKPDKWKPIEL